MPFVAALHGWQSHVFDIATGTVGRIRPRDSNVEVADDFPVREEELNLRGVGEGRRDEESVVTASGMKYINVPMTGLTPPTEAEITNILGILEDGTTGPVFVHCQRGADRTGAVIASYRIEHDGWDNARALKEAMANGMSFFQFPRQSFIRNFQARTFEAKTAPAAEPPASTVNVVNPQPAVAAPATAQ